MKLIRISFASLLVLIFLSGCKKELSLEQAESHVEEAHDFKDFLIDKDFRLKAFYTDTAIDYVEDDAEVKSETNLWGYVSGYLKDDTNTFHSNLTVDIAQNAIVMPGLTDAVLNRSFSVGSDGAGVYMQFLDYEYNPLTYRLKEMTADHFIVYVPWKNGIFLYSRFDLLP
ncbi:MAG: hypothetical protein ABI687_05330 [Flavitalea sp.]